MSCRLFHGPSAKSTALEAAGEGLLEPPYGDEGLTVKEARAIVERMLWPPVGTGKGFVVIGPVDTARPKSLDVLLKSLEEHNSDNVEPLLWAHDLDGVLPTVLSRSVPVWAPGQIDFGDLDKVSGDLLFAVEDGDFPSFLKALDGTKESDLSDLVLPLAQTATQVGSSWPTLQAIRELAVLPRLTRMEVVSVFAQLEVFNVQVQ